MTTQANPSALRDDAPIRPAVWRWFILVTAIKIAAFIALASLGRAKPFVGANAEEHYIPIAQRLISEHRFNGPDSRPDSKVPFAYPAFLAVTKVVGGAHYLSLAVCLQILSDLLVAATLYWLGAKFANPRVGLIAGLIWLLYPPAILLSTWITAETLFTAALAASVAILAMSLDRRGVTLALAAGLVLGLASLFRGTCILLPLFLLPLWFRRDIPRGLWKGAAYFAGMLAIILPWTIRNQIVLQDRIPVAVGFGSVVLQGSDERYFTIAGKQRLYPAMFAQAAASGVVKPASPKESGIDNYLMKVGIHNYRLRIHDRPMSLIPLAAHKAARLWYGTESGGRTQQLALGLCSLAIVPLGLWQLWRWRRAQPRLGILIALIVLYFALLHWATLPEFRYMYPVIPFLIPGAVQAAMGLIRRRHGSAGEPAAADTTLKPGTQIS